MRRDSVPFNHPWDEALLDEVADVVVGGTPSTTELSFWNGEIRWMASGDVHKRHIFDVPGRISETGLRWSNAVMVEPQAVAMALAGQGKTRGTVALTHVPICTNQSIALIKPRDERLDPEFLYQSLIPRYEEMRARSAGGGRGGLTKGILDRLPLQLPLSTEQRRIAEILSTVDEAIEQTESLIAKYQQIKAGLMQDLFTRGVTPDGHLRPTRVQAPHLYKESPLGWIPKGWEFATVGSCINGIDTGKSPDCPDTSASGDQWGVLKVGAIDPEGLREKENKVVIDERLKNSTFIIHQNDLLFSRANTVDLVGLVCHVTLDPGNLMLSDKTLRLRPITSLTTTRFLFYSLQTSRIRRQIENLATGTSGSMKNISQVGVESLQLVRPQPTEQAVITDRVDAWVDSINILKGETEKLRHQKHGLMHDLLTGRVRVKVAEPARS